MAELSDPVTCKCGSRWDRAVYSQCADCTLDLWDDANLMTPQQDSDAAQHGTDSSAAPGTVLEGVRQIADIELLVCGRRLTIDPGSTLELGRDEGLPTESAFRSTMNVSRHHATLCYRDGRLYVTDTDSSNGTFVNDQRLPPRVEYELRPGQRLRLASNVSVEVRWPE